MKGHPSGRIALIVLVIATVPAAALFGSTTTLKVYLLTGQSNMVGHGYVDYAAGNNYNIPTLEFLLDSTPAATTYRANMPNSTFTFASSLDASWMAPRNDVWATHYYSRRNDVKMSPGPLAPGFGGGANAFGPELGMGQRLGDALQSPVFLFKSCDGGTDLAYDWRPPSAVVARGGSVGANYTNAISQFTSFLNGLDADLADNGKLDGYNNAPGYEVAGLVWFQGWNTTNGNQGNYTTSQKMAEYTQNLVDLVHDVRACDGRIPDDLGVIVAESSDQNEALNDSRSAAVAALNAEKPGTAVFIETNNMKGSNWGDNNSGEAFSTQWSYHFNAKAENYLEIGWRMGQAAVDNDFIGSEAVVPEPTTLGLLALGGVALVRRRRR